MSIWDNEEYEISHRRGRKGKSPRTEFGIVRRATGQRQAFLYVPKRVGAQDGQKVKFVRVPEGVAFRFGDEGKFRAFKPNVSSGTLWVTLPEDLLPFAGPVVQDITVTPYQGGWLIPLDQFRTASV